MPESSSNLLMNEAFIGLDCQKIAYQISISITSIEEVWEDIGMSRAIKQNMILIDVPKQKQHYDALYLLSCPSKCDSNQ